jgi:Hydroxymethylglutaryl-coenzyme A synthase N terminal
MAWITPACHHHSQQSSTIRFSLEDAPWCLTRGARGKKDVFDIGYFSLAGRESVVNRAILGTRAMTATHWRFHHSGGVEQYRYSLSEAFGTIQFFSCVNSLTHTFHYSIENMTLPFENGKHAPTSDPAASLPGILALEVYFPSCYVKQSALEEHMAVGAGKYTIGLGQEGLAITGDVEDINSICLTVVANLLEKYVENSQ